MLRCFPCVIYEKCGMFVCRYTNRNMNDLTGISYSTRYKAKNTIPDSKLLVLGTGFLLGLVFFYFTGKQLIEDSGLLSQETIEPLKNFSMDQNGYLIYIAGIRIKQFLFVLFCSLSIWGSCFLYAVLGWGGFQWGILFYAAMYQYGMRGVFYCVFMLLPHGIFYFLAFVQFMNKKLGSDKKYYHKNINITSSKALSIGENVKTFLVIMMLLCLGILSESYINPWLMKWILLFF